MSIDPLVRTITAVAIAGVMIIGRTVADRLEVPEAVVLLILGVLASLIPRVPNIDLPPDLVLFLSLPPLIYNAAFFSAPRETRENAVPITALAFGATTMTILAVRGSRHLRAETARRAPACIVTIMEGESLITDGVALTAFGLAVEAMAHPFTFAHGLTRLVEVVLGGIAYGLVVALVTGRARSATRSAAPSPAPSTSRSEGGISRILDRDGG